ncbi:UNVERIFIED_ORG: ABC-type glycerol-3-phosphate transport system permease component, partial [Shinella zoogloeoides]|nr:ABC-type glycerol-3-phosphate transport system permease component [Shinella zoogloeoides]
MTSQATTATALQATSSDTHVRADVRTRRSLFWLVPTLYIVFLLLPIYWLVNMSFKTNTEIMT